MVSPSAQPPQTALSPEQLERLEQRRADRRSSGGHADRTERLSRLERQVLQQRQLERDFDLGGGPLPDLIEGGDRRIEHRSRVAAQLLACGLLVELEFAVVEELQQIPRITKHDDAG